MVTAGPVPACSTRWIAVGGRVKVVPGPSSRETGGRAGGGQRVLAHVARDDRDAGRRLVVVVEAGVLVLAPADDPGVDVLVVPDLLVDPGVVGVAHQVVPALRGLRQRGGEALELVDREAHAVAPIALRTWAALSASWASRPQRTGSTTGRSDPYTSWLTPTNPAIASTMPGP